jgi:tryptophan-rich sensory protein
MPRSLVRRRIGDVAALVSPFAVGALGSIPTITAIGSWYRTLDRPSWNPPDAVFGPAWTTLYLLMGIAVVLVRRAGTEETGSVAGEGERIADGARGAQAVFGLQLALNLAWSYAFFGLRSPAAGGVVIIALWLSILATIAAFARHSRLAAALLLPYLAWVTFATALNLEIWRRNPG